MNRVNNISGFLSEERVETYKNICKSYNLPDDKWTELYQLNLALSKELYPLIHNIEIVLRNKINSAFIKNLKSENWLQIIDFSLPNRNKHKKQLDEAINKVNDSKKVLNNANIITNLTFGFWVNLLGNPFAKEFHKFLINDLFDNYPESFIKRQRIHGELVFIVKLRNRIFHFEPIIKDLKILEADYNRLMMIINWFSEDLYFWSQGVSEFDVKYKELKTLLGFK